MKQRKSAGKIHCHSEKNPVIEGHFFIFDIFASFVFQM